MKLHNAPDNPIRRALDEELAFLDGRPSLHHDVMTKIKGEEIVKKKISVGFALALAMLLVSAVALALGLSQQFFEDVATLQFESGYYDDWGLTEKQAMVHIMHENGIIDDAQAAAMTDEASIDRYMIDRYGIEGRSDVIGLVSIFETELGSMSGWDQERWVWYCDLMVETGLMKAGGDQYFHYMPGDEAITEAEAISRAAAYIEADFSLPAGSLDQSTAMWHYLTDAADMFDRKYGRHYVSFDGYEIWLRPNGERWTEEDDLLASPYDWEIRRMITDYKRENDLPNGLANFGPEHAAACMAELLPVLHDNIAGNPDYRDPLGLWIASHTYGVPDDKAITQDEALAIAGSAIPDGHAAHIEAFSVLYETTDPAAPLWKLTGRDTTHDEAVTWRVFINAYTGDVIETYSYDPYATMTAEEVVASTF